LPFAVIGMLVVYCLKGTEMTAWPFGLPEIIASAAVILLHKLNKNMLLSIAGGTLCYMLLVQVVFERYFGKGGTEAFYEESRAQRLFIESKAAVKGADCRA